MPAIQEPVAQGRLLTSKWPRSNQQPLYHYICPLVQGDPPKLLAVDTAGMLMLLPGINYLREIFLSYAENRTILITGFFQ